jgi:hypothetical protein
MPAMDLNDIPTDIPSSSSANLGDFNLKVDPELAPAILAATPQTDTPNQLRFDPEVAGMIGATYLGASAPSMDKHWLPPAIVAPAGKVLGFLAEVAVAATMGKAMGGAEGFRKALGLGLASREAHYISSAVEYAVNGLNNTRLSDAELWLSIARDQYRLKYNSVFPASIWDTYDMGSGTVGNAF